MSCVRLLYDNCHLLLNYFAPGKVFMYNKYIENETEGAGLCPNSYESSDEPCSAYAFLHVLPFLCTT